MRPNWSRIYINEQANETVYEIELKNPKKMMQASEQMEEYKEALTEKNTIKLLIFKNKAGLITAGCYMSVLTNDQG